MSVNAGIGQGQAGTSRDKAGTSRDRAGTNRDKRGQTWTFPFCPCLSLLVPVCPCRSLLVPAFPCLSLSVPVCPCLYVSTFDILSCQPLHMNIRVFISRNIVTLTFLQKPLVQCRQTVFLTSSLLFILLPQYLVHSIRTVLFQ